MNSRNLLLYITAESPCSYFNDRLSRSLVPDPDISLNMSIYNQLIQRGFRRSGGHSYKPHCENCKACVACRIPVNEFTRSRSQQRCFKNNMDLDFSIENAEFTEEYFELYQRYLDARHSDSSMANPKQDEFKQFLYGDWTDTKFITLRSQGKLVAVAVTDIICDGLSAVYSFFDPEMSKRSLGTYCILQQIEHAKATGLDYVYLGYWIKGQEKMQYKKNFKPLELYIDEQWQAPIT